MNIQVSIGEWQGKRSGSFPGNTKYSVAWGEVGTGTVATKAVPAWTIIASNPARRIRSLTEWKKASLKGLTWEQAVRWYRLQPTSADFVGYQDDCI
jgi:hypothetical protein